MEQRTMDAIREDMAAAKAAIESGDASAIETAEALVAEAEAVEKAAENDNEKEQDMEIKEAVEVLGKDSASIEAKPATLGEFAAKNFAGVAKSGERFSKSIEFKTDPTFIGGVQQIQYDKNPAQVLKETRIADLFGHETISGNALTFYRVADLNGSVGTTAEGAKKNQVDFSATAVTVALTKITGFLKESEELVEDAEWLADGMEERLLNKLALAEEAQLLAGNGTAPNMTGIVNTSGIGSVTYTHGGTMAADDIFKAIMKVKNDSDLSADAIIMNPADYQTFRLAKDSNNQYYGGGYFYGPYGNGNLAAVPPLWGVPTYLSTSITQGTALVGAFKQGASIVSKRGVRVEMTNTDVDDFEKNLVTIRAEKREALAVRIPAAFVLVSEAAAS